MRLGVKGGQLKFLSEDQLYQIHLATMKILENIGIKIDHPETVELLKQNGAEVNQQKHIVKIPQYLVEESIRKAPKSIRLCGRNPENDFELYGDQVFYGLGSGTPMILDPITHDWRESTKRDVENAAKLADALPQIDYVMGLGTPSDMNTDIIGLHEFDAMIRNTEKHMVLYGYHGGALTKEIIKMGEVVTGSNEKLRKNPLFTLYAEPLSPLVFETKFLTSIIEFAKNKLPVIWGPCPGSGATSPVTLAGTIAQGSAESLGGLVITQLYNPGTPFIYYLTPIPMNMKTTVFTYCFPEKLLMNSALAQLAHYYRLPFFGTGGMSDSSTLDAQVASEATSTLFMESLSGANLIHDIGYIESGKTGCFELIVMCNDIITSIKRILKSIDINENTLAVDVIEEVGVGGHFLDNRHTFNYAKKEYVYPELFTQLPRLKWETLGSKDFIKRANEKVTTILKNYEPTPLGEDVTQDLNQILTTKVRDH